MYKDLIFFQLLTKLKKKIYNFTVEMPGRHKLDQVLNANINSFGGKKKNSCPTL